MTDAKVRALRPADASAARALVSAQFGGTPYAERFLEQLASATNGGDPECRALVVGDVPAAAVLFGSVDGAGGVVKLHVLAGNDRRALHSLAAAVRDSNARLVVCEMAEEPVFDVTGQILRELGFEEAGRVADFFRDGVDLVILTWRSL